MNLVTGWLSQIERVKWEELDCNATLKHKALIPIGRALSFGVPAHKSFGPASSKIPSGMALYWISGKTVYPELGRLKLMLFVYIHTLLVDNCTKHRY